METFLYNYLDELLFLFSTEKYFLAREIKILELDLENWIIKGIMYGEEMDHSIHEQGK